MEKEIAQLTKTELLNPEFIPSIFEIYPDEKERQDILVQILDVAKREKVFTKVKTAIDRNVRSVKLTNNIVNAILIMNNQGETEASTENFVTIMETTTFVALIGSFKLYYDIILGMIIGGMIAAPIGAVFCKKIPTKTMLKIVGLLVIILNTYNQ